MVEVTDDQIDETIKRVAAQMRASASGRGSSAQSLLPSERELEARAAPVAAQLEAAARSVAALRDASGYHWVQVGQREKRGIGRMVLLTDWVLSEWWVGGSCGMLFHP